MAWESLAPSLAVGLVAPSLWLQTRSVTLATDLIVLGTFPTYLLQHTGTPEWGSAVGGQIAAATGLAFMVIYAVGQFAAAIRRRRTNRVELAAIVS